MDFRENIVLETERVRLSPLEAAHYNDLLPVVEANPDLLRYSPSLLRTGAHLRDYLQAALEARERAQRYPFVVFDRADGRCVGSTSYGNVSARDERLEIGWTWLDPRVQGTGLNRHAKFLLLRHAFEGLDYRRVEFKTDARNTQSRRAIAKIGGTEEGTLRSHTLMADGFRRDTVYFSILREEWAALRGTVFADLKGVE
ncbi:RimJ/RimL family protein N-acetyltransferase [Neolewinella xylanilytica]|uniref:RimJ/RimL family protein N-acetyltransferase n=1 Tax=Neolewinella xylanilytica TaxID=1514080 RepID=A0A2S6IAG7_9BACT|nr:GNAT family protein [Neolewinella xylanilytica]PPK88494.1 RimJ/RimL family protein N-acetyltransferase [Neolewinella xylanilytica]